VGRGTAAAAARGHPGRADADDAALARLQEALDALNRVTDGVRFAIGQHVAIDRWTGGASEGLLFATLEPHATTGQSWQPMVLDLDIGRLGDDTTADRALVLLLLVLRDLCDGWFGFGHGTTRGMGAVAVDAAAVRFHTGPGVARFGACDGRSLADLFHDDLIHRIAAAWPPDATTQGSTA
jgi:hypothetical protein